MPQPTPLFGYETKILGSCMGGSDEAMSMILRRVRPEYFDDRINKFVFEKLSGFYREGTRDITVDFLCARFGEKLVNKVGGKDFLRGLEAIGIRSLDELDAIIDVFVSRYAIKRKVELLDSLSRELSEYDGSDVSLVLSKGEKEFYDLSKEFAYSNNTEKAVILGENAREVTSGIARGDAKYCPVYTGWKQFDEHVPLKPGKLYAICARAKSGKSSLALELARNIGLIGVVENNGVIPCAVIDTEMTEEEVSIRLIASMSGITQQVIESGSWAADGDVGDFSGEPVGAAIENALQTVEGRSKIHWMAMPSPTVEKIASEARVLVRRYGIRLLIFDWLRVDESFARKNKQEYQVVGEIITGLHNLAKELSIPVIVMCQMSKAATDDAVRKAVQSGYADLSGSIAMSDRIAWGSDAVVILRKTLPGVDYQDGDEVVAWGSTPNRLLSIALNRSGPVHTVTEGFEFFLTAGTYRMKFIGERSEASGGFHPVGEETESGSLEAIFDGY